MSFRLPEAFTNVSELRQVPDNQEVFVDQTSDVSLILELLELERGLTPQQVRAILNLLCHPTHRSRTTR